MKTKNFALIRIALKAGLSKEQIRKKDFREANFSVANFSGADFSVANFSGADFSVANLNYKINESTFGLTINCPEEGSFIAYKKCQGTIVKLLIPEDAKRSSATTYKCRASKAICLEIMDGRTEISSDYNCNFIYRVGKTVTVADFDEDRWNECSTGIHFFMSRKMAEQYS